MSLTWAGAALRPGAAVRALLRDRPAAVVATGVGAVAVRRTTQEARTLVRASCLCALGRIRTCNLLIRSQMLYPLSYECLFCFLSSLPGLSTRSRRQEEHYMTAAVM